MKRERFVRVAERRVNSILMQFDRLSRCSNKRNYEYNQQDIKKIFNAIEKRVKETKDMFLQEGGGEKEFSL
jgi:hypothetical protein